MCVLPALDGSTCCGGSKSICTSSDQEGSAPQCCSAYSAGGLSGISCGARTADCDIGRVFVCTCLSDDPYLPYVSRSEILADAMAAKGSSHYLLSAYCGCDGCRADPSMRRHVKVNLCCSCVPCMQWRGRFLHRASLKAMQHSWPQLLRSYFRKPLIHRQLRSALALHHLDNLPAGLGLQHGLHKDLRHLQSTSKVSVVLPQRTMQHTARLHERLRAR